MQGVIMEVTLTEDKPPKSAMPLTPIPDLTHH